MRATCLVNYTPAALRGLIAGSDRSSAVQMMLNQVGGKLVSLAFTRGEYDAIVTVDLPDRNAAVAGMIAVLASGSLTRMTMLEELDMAAVLPLAKQAAAAFKPAG